MTEPTGSRAAAAERIVNTLIDAMVDDPTVTVAVPDAAMQDLYWTAERALAAKGFLYLEGSGYPEALLDHAAHFGRIAAESEKALPDA